MTRSSVASRRPAGKAQRRSNTLGISRSCNAASGDGSESHSIELFWNEPLVVGNDPYFPNSLSVARERAPGEEEGDCVTCDQSFDPRTPAADVFTCSYFKNWGLDPSDATSGTNAAQQLPELDDDYGR